MKFPAWPKVGIAFLVSVTLSLLITNKIQLLLYSDVLDGQSQAAQSFIVLGLEFHSTGMVMLFIAGVIVMMWLFLLFVTRFE